MANVVTFTGKSVIAGRMFGSTPTQTEPKFLCWGTNPASLTASGTDVSLFFESQTAGRTSGTASLQTTTYTNDTIQWTGTMTAGGTLVIQEAALADSATQPAQAVVAAGGVVGSSVSTTLNTGATYTPTNNAYVQIRTEVMQVTAGSGSQALTVTRAQNGTTAISTISTSDNIQAGNIPGLGGVNTTGGTLLAHSNFSAVNLNSGDSISFTWKLAFNP
jgi:hypothetical protein